ncbi:MAG: DUF6064 family protein [Desulfobacula sp.]|nr:DUF6064 family protein [Desulfobacula sp.]
MIDAQTWWGIIRAYGSDIFPAQIITVFIAAIITWLIIKRPGNLADFFAKIYFTFCFAWIGIVFFIMHGQLFAGMQEYVQAGLFITLSVLFGLDIFKKRISFRWPGSRWHQMILSFLLFAVFAYPLVGMAAGHFFPGMIIVGTHPCPTAAFALILLAAALPGTNKLLYGLLLIWAIPFPIFIQIPKFGVYEDTIMLMCGLFALIMLLKSCFKKK